MRNPVVWVGAALCLVSSFLLGSPSRLPAQEASEELAEPWLEPIPVPADPELEAQIQEVQEALSAIHRQAVRRKDALKETSDAATQASLFQDIELLRKEREDLEALLHDLVDEAKMSERTAIDEALAKARWLERQEEQWYQKEELIRDRKE